MRNAPRHIRPGGIALRGYKRGNIVQRRDGAIAALLRRDTQQNGAARAAAGCVFQLDLHRFVVFAIARAGENIFRLWYQISKAAAMQNFIVIIRRPHQKLRRPEIRQRDMPQAVKADNAGRCAGQYRLGKTPAFIEHTVGGQKLFLLALQLAGHAVKFAAKDDDFVVLFARRC